MAITPRVMLKIAVMMRDNGRFDGTQIISEDWVNASRIVRARSPYSGLGYGLGWFITPSGYLIARGYGGQIIAANSERRLAVAITSDPTRPARSDGHFGRLMRILERPVFDLTNT